MKKLDLNKSVYHSTEQYPELIDIIAKMGYPQVKNAFLRKTMGKASSINDAIRQLNLNKATILKQFEAHGFECID